MDNVINDSFGNAIYELCKKNEFDESVKLGSIGMAFGKQPLVQQNFVYALQENAKEHIRQKDSSGALELVIKFIKDFPDTPNIKTLPSIIFQENVVGLLKSGNFKEAENIFIKFKSILSDKEMQTFQDNIYIATTYDLIKEKSYQKAIYIAKKRLLVLFSANLFNNFKNALYNLFLSTIDSVDYVKIINDYNENILLFKDQKNLSTDLGYFISQKGQVFVKTNDYIKINDMLKKLKEKVENGIFESTAVSIFVNATYDKNIKQKYENTLTIAEQGFIWTKNPRLIENYEFAFNNLGKIYKSAGDKNKLTALNIRIKKILPDNVKVKKFEDNYLK